MKIIGQNIGPQQTLDYTDEKIEPQQRGLNCGFFFFFYNNKTKKTITALFPPKNRGKKTHFLLCCLYSIPGGLFVI